MTGHAKDVFSVCGCELGVQIEQVNEDGSLSCWFATPDGHLFAPAVPDEYAGSMEFIGVAQLPSGMDYAVIDSEEFAILAALELSYGGKLKKNKARILPHSCGS